MRVKNKERGDTNNKRVVLENCGVNKKAGVLLGRPKTEGMEL